MIRRLFLALAMVVLFGCSQSIEDAGGPPTPPMSKNPSFESVTIGGVGLNATIVAPNAHYAVMGVESNIWFDSLLAEDAGKDLINWDVAQSGSAGSHVTGKWTDTPTDTTDNATTTTFAAHDTAGNLLSSKAMTYRVASATAPGTVNLLYIGDSTVNGAEITTALEAFDTTDSDLTLNLIGTLDGPNFNEGYAGKTVDWFYTHADSPFTKEGAFNYAAYLTDNILSTPDIIVIQLGINDVFAKTTDAQVATTAAANIVQLEAMITAFRAVNTGTKTVLNLVTLPSTQTRMGGDYGTGQTAWRVKRNMQLYNQSLIAHTWSESVTLLPVNLNIDIANGMTNGVHPNATGYQDIADAVYALVKNLVPVHIAYHDSGYNDAVRRTTTANFTEDGDDLKTIISDNFFSGVSITYVTSKKTTYDVKASVALGADGTRIYCGVLLWNGANAVDYDFPEAAQGALVTYLANLNYTSVNNAPLSLDTTIDLTGAPDFTHISLHISGYVAGHVGTELALIDLSETSIKATP